MATIKSYTDLEQSKKLAEILTLESADMKWFFWKEEIDAHKTPTFGYSKTAAESYKDSEAVYLPCWSLASLLEQLHYELFDDDGNSSYLQMNKEDDVYQLVYTDPHVDFESIETDRYEHFIDACYELILKLHELNLL